MSDRRETFVLQALARFLGVKERQLLPWLRLKRDLKLEPLDLVLFVLELEESSRLAFSFERLERVSTVSDLVQVVALWVREREHDTQCDVDERLLWAETSEVRTAPALRVPIG